MPFDATQTLQASVTKTASFNGAWLDLGGGSGVPSPNMSGGTPTYGLVARVEYSAATNATGANSFTFSLDEGDDGVNPVGTGFVQATDKTVNLSTTAQSGEIFIPFEIRHRYIRLVATLGGGGTVPTITYQGELIGSWP